MTSRKSISNCNIGEILLVGDISNGTITRSDITNIEDCRGGKAYSVKGQSPFVVTDKDVVKTIGFTVFSCDLKALIKEMDSFIQFQPEDVQNSFKRTIEQLSNGK